MFAILVVEPGSDVQPYVLTESPSDLEAAMRLMYVRAEEFIDEATESDDQEYVIEEQTGGLVVKAFDMNVLELTANALVAV